MAFRPNWYEDGSRRRGLSSISGWSGFRWILTLNIVAFLVQALTEPGAPGSGLPFTELLALRTWWPHPSGFAADPFSNVALHGAFNWFFPLQLVTYAFLHAGLMHIGFNMLYLWFFGPEVEATLGRRGFLQLYLGGAVFGGLCQWAWWLRTGDASPVIGASGAVYTVMIYYALKWPRRQILLWLVIPIPVWLLVVARVGSDAWDFAHPPPPGMVGVTTAVLVHLGGAAFGLLWFKGGGALTGALERRRRNRALREFQAEATDRREMDRILAKIQATGLSSLDARERAFLDHRSRVAREQRNAAR